MHGAMFLKYIVSFFRLPITYIILLLVVISVMGIFHVKQNGIFARLVAVENLDEYETDFDESTANIISSKIFGNSEQEIRTKLMNLVTKTGSDHSDSPLVLLEQTKNGKGMVCGGLASVYFNALKGHGYKARMVKLLRQSVHTLDVHQTVEIWKDGGWKISDPTFNVEFWKDEKRIGVEEVQKSVFSGNYRDVDYRFMGDVRYPARLSDYYLNWQPLFNNVLIMGRSVYSAQMRFGVFLAKFPPFRYWFGPVYFYQIDSVDQHALNKATYFLTMVALPILLVILAIVACFQNYYVHFRSRPRSRT
jgi:hypothetical protein